MASFQDGTATHNLPLRIKLEAQVGEVVDPYVVRCEVDTCRALVLEQDLTSHMIGHEPPDDPIEMAHQ